MPADAPEGLCPRCLGAMHFATETVLPEERPHAALPPLSPEELAPSFPQLEILACLGRGGMGVVYKARQKSLDRLVALKLLAPERVHDAGFAERFAREARALAALNHPNIVTVHDFGEAGGYFYLLMEFVDGVNLREAMKAGRFTPEQALAVVPPICDALQYAHEHGIVHRDIKPENLLLDRAGWLKIGDFGIAKMLGADAEIPAKGVDIGESQPAGTPQYMAPEQKAGSRQADHRADIYSLGVVLYEMLTGELPADKLLPPSRKVHLDVRLDEIVLRALERVPELRYQTALDMRTQLETVAPRPEVGAAGATGSDWRTWSPMQTPLVQEICAHMTEAEKSETTKRGFMFGVWNALTIFGPFFCIMFLPSPLRWIYGAILLVVGLSFYPMWRRMQREFLCSTAWAKQRGIKPEQVELFATTPAQRQLYEAMGFRSVWGQRFVRLSFLGFLGFLGGVGFVEGWERMRGFFGFFGFLGFLGVATIVEFWQRRRAAQRGAVPRHSGCALLAFVVLTGGFLLVALLMATWVLSYHERPTAARAPDLVSDWIPAPPVKGPAASPVEQFDQTPGAGWRALTDQKRYADAASLIESFLVKHPELAAREKANLHFHAAQCLAFDGQAASLESARAHLREARVDPEPSDSPVRWNDYVAATQAFLAGDLPALKAARERIAAGPKVNGAAANLDVVDRMIASFGKSYREAYETTAGQR